MADSSFADRSAREPDAEPHQASAAATPRDPVLARLIDLVADRALALRSAGSEVTDLTGLHEAIAALEGYRSALDFAKAGAPDGTEAAPVDVHPAPDPPPPSAPDVTSEPSASNGASPTDEPERDYPPFRDQVTGLHSREGFDAVASGELKRCRRHGRVFSLVLLRLPRTDEDGLRRAANAVSTAIRDSDLAGRQIDGTLAVALPEAPPNEARVVAERIIGHCEGVGLWDPDSRVALVSHPAHGETLAHLLEAASVQLTLPAQRVLAALNRGPWPAGEV